MALSGCRDLLGPPTVLDTDPNRGQGQLGTRAGAGGEGPFADAGAGDPSADVPSQSCVPEETKCVGVALQRCALDGSGLELIQRCAAPELCEAGDDVLARCVPPVCAAGAVRCTAEGVLQRCRPERTGYDDLEDCGFAAYCDPELGACTETPCEAGALSCNGGTLQRCAQDEASGEFQREDVTACASQELCSVFRQQCAMDASLCEGAGVECTPPTCSEGQGRCVGTRLELCNAALTEFAFERECPTAELCNDAPGTAATCLPEVCSPGDLRCSALGAIEQCNAGQTGFEPTGTQCRSAAFCQPTGCTADPCVPGTQACNGAVLQRCEEIAGGQDVQQVELETCASAALCTSEACLPPQCVAGSLVCQGAQLLRCRADRTGFDSVQTCQTAELCQLAVGSGSCPAPCSGFECTAAGVLRGCNAGLTALEDLEDCGTAAECDAVQGSCAEPCIEGQFRCNGVALEVCENRLDGWRRLATCRTAELCGISRAAGATTCEPPRCEPGQHRCNGQALQACNPGMTGFAQVQACAAGTICDAPNRQCDVCAPDTTSCDGATLVRCLATGQGEVRTQCGAVCAPSGDGFACLACEPAGSTECSSEGVRSQCVDNPRRLVQVETCREPGLCDQQAGICLGCAPVGSFRCDGANLMECGVGNVETVAQVCGSVALCTGREQDDACGDASCSERQLRCAGREVLVCNNNLTGFTSQSPPVNCDTAQLCDASVAGGCNPAVCDAGEFRCEGQSVVQCNEGRTALVPLETCDSAALCNAPNCPPNGSCCAPRACDSGQRQCNGTDLVECNQDLTGFNTVASCDRPELCDFALTQGNDTCPECLSNETFCTNGELEVCRNGQLESAPCGPGLTCEENTAGAARCACVPGELRCSSTGQLQRCNDEGTAFATEPACLADGTLQQCVGGQVVTQACGAGLCSAANGGSCLECAPGNNAACNDENACTTDTCNANGQCINVAINCSDAFSCTTDSCDVANGCVNTPSNAACSDDLACNGAETCSPGNPNAGTDGCVAGTPLCPSGQQCNEQTDQCVGCVVDADCTDPAARACGAGGNCVQCTDSAAHCASGEVCDANLCVPDPAAAGAQ